MSAMEEPGLDMHEWETRWQDLQDEAADDPVQTLPEIVRLVEEMVVGRGFAEEPVTAEGEAPDVVRQLQSAREIARLIDAGEAVETTDVIEELDGLREIHDYLVQDRTAP